VERSGTNPLEDKKRLSQFKINSYIRIKNPNKKEKAL